MQKEAIVIELLFMHDFKISVHERRFKGLLMEWVSREDVLKKMNINNIIYTTIMRATWCNILIVKS